MGFTINDSKIYITLLKIGLSSPAKISEKSQVDRARVYDSLKRLVKRSIVEEEPVPRAPRYRAISPEKVFGSIRNDYNRRIKLSESLEDQLKNFKIASKTQNSVWAVQGDSKILKRIIQFIEEAKNFIFLIITPDISTSSKDLGQITEILLDRRNSSPEIAIKIGLLINSEDQSLKHLINRLFHANIEVYKWDIGSVLPFGLILTEQSFLQTYLNSTTPKPKYEFGIFMENCSEQQLIGLQHLNIWVFSHFCKKVLFHKKKKAQSDD